MKRVGVLMSKVSTNMGNKGFILYQEINNYLLKNQIISVGFTPPVIKGKLNYKMLGEMLENFDGVILEGGDDFDEFNLAIAKYLYDHNIPCLGICLGMQTMCSLFNGQMIDIDEHLSVNKYSHFVYLNKHSELYKIIKKRKILVNSRHKSAIIKTDLKINACSNVIEAVNDDNKKFFMGVQWHPESLDDVNSYKLFKAFFASL